MSLKLVLKVELYPDNMKDQCEISVRKVDTGASLTAFATDVSEHAVRGLMDGYPRQLSAQACASVVLVFSAYKSLAISAM